MCSKHLMHIGANFGVEIGQSYFPTSIVYKQVKTRTELSVLQNISWAKATFVLNGFTVFAMALLKSILFRRLNTKYLLRPHFSGTYNIKYTPEKIVSTFFSGTTINLTRISAITLSIKLKR